MHSHNVVVEGICASTPCMWLLWSWDNNCKLHVLYAMKFAKSTPKSVYANYICACFCSECFANLLWVFNLKSHAKKLFFSDFLVSSNYLPFFVFLFERRYNYSFSFLMWTNVHCQSCAFFSSGWHTLARSAGMVRGASSARQKSNKKHCTHASFKKTNIVYFGALLQC